MLERIVFELHLKDSNEKLKVRRVNTMEVINSIGYLPDLSIFIPQQGQPTASPNAKLMQDLAKWACLAIVEHPSKKIVPSLEVGDGEFSYFDLSDQEQADLFVAATIGEKKTEPQSSN